MSEFDRDQAEVFLGLVFGERSGTVCLTFGRDPHRDQRGKYGHRSWSERDDKPRTDLYRWPAERGRLLGDVAREMTAGPVDVYVCPALRHASAKARRKGDALPAVWLWADLDGPAKDPALLDKLDPLVVRSGSDDHQHVYVALDAAALPYGGVPVAVLERLNQRLAELLGGDAKWSDESLLRLPGTLNHKSDPPAPVTLTGTEHRVWPLAEVAALLGIDLGIDNHTAGAASSGSSTADSGPLPSAEPAPAELPGPVRRALDKPSSGDRSADAAGVVEACAFAGLTPGQALSVLAGHPSAAHYKNGRHMADDVARLYRKYGPKHPMTPEDQFLMGGTSTPERGSQKPQNPDPAPTPLRAARVPAVFPVDALPGWASEWVAAEATATQTPPDLAGCCALGVFAACAGGRAVVQVRGGWREPVNLYVLPVLPPGSRKSAVIAAATHPLYAAEEDLGAQVRGQMIEAQTIRDIASKAAEKAFRAAANATDEAKRRELTSDAVSAASQAEAMAVPVVPRLIADDVTAEAVGSLLAEHGGRLAVISAEGGIFETIGGRYSNGIPNMDVWLKGHAGDPLRIDRRGRASEYVKAPALTLLLSVQPAVLAGIARNGTFRGRGLTARFLYSIPPDNVGRRQVGAPPVPDDVAATWDKRVRQLVDELAGWTDPAVLQLTPAAHDLVLGLERAVEPRLARDGEYGSIRGWGSKFVGAVVRIAGLLHLAGDGQPWRAPITEATVAAAIRIGGYFAEHAKTAFDLIGDGGTTDALYLLEFLRRRQREEFTIRALLTDLPRGRFGSTDDVAAVVDTLAEHGWVIAKPAEPRTGAGRPPSPAFRTHPSVFADEVAFTAVEVAAQSAQSAEPPTAARSADCADSADTSPAVNRARQWPGSADSADNADTNRGAS